MTSGRLWQLWWYKYKDSWIIYNLFDELWIAEDYHEHSWYSRGLTVLWAVLCCLWIYFIPRSRVILVEEVYKFSDYDFGRGKNWIWRDGIGFMIQFVQDLVINSYLFAQFGLSSENDRRRTWLIWWCFEVLLFDTRRDWSPNRFRVMPPGDNVPLFVTLNIYINK